MNAQSTERRQYERVSTERPVTLTDPDRHHFEGKMIDISTHGVGVIMQDTEFTTDDLQLQFNLPTSGTAPLLINAAITHNCRVRGERLLGLEFTELSPRYEIAINEFIRFHHRLD